MSLLEVERLDAQHGLLKAVRGRVAGIDEGETIALVGANGAGKTTLLRDIAGAHRPAGRARSLRRRRHHRGCPRIGGCGLGIALVPEGRRLFPGLTVEENLARRRPRGGRGRVERRDRVLEVFPMLQTAAHAAGRDPVGRGAAGHGDRPRADV